MTYLYIYKNENKKKVRKNYIFHWTSNNSSILSWWGWKSNCGLILNSSVCSLPSEIVGDISYEELRAAAYDDNKRGVSLQSIVRNLTYHIWLFCNCMLINILRMTYQKKKTILRMLTFIFVESMKIHRVHASFNCTLTFT